MSVYVCVCVCVREREREREKGREGETEIEIFRRQIRGITYISNNSWSDDAKWNKYDRGR